MTPLLTGGLRFRHTNSSPSTVTTGDATDRGSKPVARTPPLRRREASQSCLRLSGPRCCQPKKQPPSSMGGAGNCSHRYAVEQCKFEHDGAGNATGIIEFTIRKVRTNLLARDVNNETEDTDQEHIAPPRQQQTAGDRGGERHAHDDQPVIKCEIAIRDKKAGRSREQVPPRRRRFVHFDRLQRQQQHTVCRCFDPPPSVW